MKLNEGNFSFGNVTIHFWDKPYQEINSKSHLNNILLCKQGKILSVLNMSSFNLFHFTYLCSLLQWNWKMPIIKSIILQPMKNGVRWKNICPMKKYLTLFHVHCLGSL